MRLICPRMLSIISEALDGAMYGAYDTSSIALLEWKLRKYLVCTDIPTNFPSSIEKKPLCQEFFLLALLVYIERASSKTTRQSNTIRSRLEAAFEILPQLDTVQRQFPLLIIGCEAKSDEHRIAVLDLITRTEEKDGLQNLGSLRAMIQSLWVQDDLAERELGYSEKIEAVLSSSPTLPSFA